jgi:cell division protein FtsW
MAQRLKTDWTLFLTILMLVGFGLVMVYSASSLVAEFKFRDTSHFFVRQLMWAVLSFLALMFFKNRDYHRLNHPAWAFTPLGLVLLALVVVYVADPGTHRWLRAFGLSLQPSEFAKPALVLFLAYFVSLRANTINNRYTLGPSTVVVVVLALMVGIADLGTAIVLVTTAVVIFYVAGLERRYLVTAMMAGLVLVVIAVAAKPYRMGRIIGYVDPEYKLLDHIDPSGAVKNYIHRSASAHDPSYQVRQSKIALGAGGVLGVGLMQGKQKLLYLPEAHTDFIYAVVGEELGLWGSTALLIGFIIIMWRGMRLYWLAPDGFGRYLAVGLTTAIVVQAFINMSVVVDIIPNKGIPLPMISSGGSSLLSTLTSLGLLLSVSERSG